MLSLAALYRYPLKSAQAEALTHCSIAPIGLQYDRHWMLCTPDGQFLSARTHPALLQLRCEITATGFALHAPDQASQAFQLSDFSPMAQVTVWESQFPAWQANAALNQWCSDYLGEPVLLCWIGPESARRTKRRPEVPVSFSDGYPLLLIGEGSWHELNERAGQQFDILRFRPNLLIAGAEPFAEDRWQQIRIGEVLIDLVKPCERCVITTRDPVSGQMLPKGEPLRTLAKFRRAGSEVLFGQNAVPLNHGELRVGQSVEIISYKE
ncbi:MOSC domain-containing protein [Chitinibacter sp. ZOR0017]|uniref:MOSC domain-containing protein n=1 Tax=Chitinibacter sp. ZOR0017 TaxID=1339254 RepID=UPI00068B156D|nr:MOSC domain-containing protein [Chitinibacter sp. ZOR0017]